MELNFFNKMSPQAKQYTVIGAAVVAFVSVLALSLGDSKKGPEERWNAKTDKQVNVLTNDSQKNMGVDSLAGRIKYLDAQNRTLQERVNRLIKDRQADKNDTTREREWKERFDALTSEVNKLRAQQRDMGMRGMNGGGGTNNGADDPQARANRGGEQIDDPFQMREQKRRELFGDEMENELRRGQPGAGGGGRAKNNGGATTTRVRSGGSITMNVVSDPDIPDEEEVAKAAAQQKKGKTKEKEQRVYIPAGSIFTGTMITGADFPTGSKSRENPTPVLLRVSKSAILPNRYKSDVRDCFLLASGHGDLSTERVQLRSEMLSCVRNDGGIIQTKLSGYVAGEDGKAGMRGRLVSKTGTMIARTMVAGFLSGMSEAFDYDPVEVLSTTATNNVQYQQKWSQDALKGGFAQGLTKSLDRVADFYMNLADQMTPALEISAGRQVDLIVVNGTYLDVMNDTKQKTAPAPASGTATVKR